MGYDYGECILCYLRCGCNESGPHYNNVCFQCLDEAANGRKTIGRVTSEIHNEHALSFEDCDKCDRKNVFVVYSTICENCQEKFKKIE